MTLFTEPRSSEVVIKEALEHERREIARMLHAEAAKHENAAQGLRADYDYREVGEEVRAHEADANLINRLADMILARTPVVAAAMTDDIAF